jgi:hypothetical protein
VSALTVDAYLPDVRRYLARRGGSDLGEVTAAEVSKAVLGEVASRSPASLRRYGCAHGAEGTSHRQGHPARHRTRPLPAARLTARLPRRLVIVPTLSAATPTPPAIQPSGRHNHKVGTIGVVPTSAQRRFFAFDNWGAHALRCARNNHSGLACHERSRRRKPRQGGRGSAWPSNRWVSASSGWACSLEKIAAAAVKFFSGWGSPSSSVQRPSAARVWPCSNRCP